MRNSNPAADLIHVALEVKVFIIFQPYGRLQCVMRGMSQSTNSTVNVLSKLNRYNTHQPSAISLDERCA